MIDRHDHTRWRRKAEPDQAKRREVPSFHGEFAAPTEAPSRDHESSVRETSDCSASRKSANGRQTEGRSITRPQTAARRRPGIMNIKLPRPAAGAPRGGGYGEQRHFAGCLKPGERVEGGGQAGRGTRHSERPARPRSGVDFYNTVILSARYVPRHQSRSPMQSSPLSWTCCALLLRQGATRRWPRPSPPASTGSTASRHACAPCRRLPRSRRWRRRQCRPKAHRMWNWPISKTARAWQWFADAFRQHGGAAEVFPRLHPGLWLPARWPANRRRCSLPPAACTAARKRRCCR